MSINRHTNGRFAHQTHSEPEVRLVSLDSYEHVDHEDEIYRQVRQFIKIAKDEGQEPEQAGAWLRQFNPHETRGLTEAA